MPFYYITVEKVISEEKQEDFTRMIRKSHPIMDLNLAEDMYSFMLTYTDKSKIAFEQYGTDAVSYINCRQRLPFIIAEGKIRWDVPLKEVTLHEFVDTFYSNYGEKTEIEFLEVEQCYEEDDYETENEVFYKYLKATVKKWRPRKRKISIRELKRFTEQNEMPVRYILRAIWLKKSYSLSEFCTLFSVEKAEASKILNAAGYLKKDTDVTPYYEDPKFQSVSSDERKNMILYHNDGFECTIKYYDIYGNYYFQKFFARRRDMGGRVYISSFPPELVLRTKRMRYTQ